MGSTWRRRRRGQTHGAGVQQRPSETVGRGCAEAHRLKSPGAEALLAIGGPGAARIGALGGLRPGRRRVGVARLGTRRRPALAGGGGARRPGDGPELGGLQRPCSLQRPRSAQGPGAHRRLWTSSPASAVLFSREERALPRPTREPRSHHLARRAALAAGGGCRFRGTRRRRLAVRRRLGCNGAWTRSEAGGVRAGEASEGGEGCSLTLAHGRPRLAAAARC